MKIFFFSSYYTQAVANTTKLLYNIIKQNSPHIAQATCGKLQKKSQKSIKKLLQKKSLCAIIKTVRTTDGNKRTTSVATNYRQPSGKTSGNYTTTQLGPTIAMR